MILFTEMIGLDIIVVVVVYEITDIMYSVSV